MADELTTNNESNSEEKISGKKNDDKKSETKKSEGAKSQSKSTATKTNTTEKTGGGTNWALIITVGVLSICCCCIVTVAAGAGLAAVTVDEESSSSSSFDPEEETSRDTEPTTSTRSTIGEPVRINDFEIEVEEFDQEYTSDSQYLQPEPGTKYVAVKVSVTNLDTTSNYIGLFDFTLDYDQETDVSTTFLTGREPELQSSYLEEGETVTGWLTYEIADDAMDVELVYDPISLSSDSRAIIELN